MHATGQVSISCRAFFGIMLKKVILSFRFDVPLYFFLLYFFSAFPINVLIFLNFQSLSLGLSLINI